MFGPGVFYPLVVVGWATLRKKQQMANLLVREVACPIFLIYKQYDDYATKILSV